MADTPDKGKRKQVVLSSSTIKTFGVKPQKDPKFNMSFYLWDTMFPKSESGMPSPTYTVQETAKLFFGKGSDWLRWRYREAPNYPNGYFVLNGIVLEPKRTEAGNRYYTLADIERMAHALVENHAIDPEQLVYIIQMVLMQAKINHIIGEPEPE